MDKVYTLDEAEQWFLKHSEGTVICVKGSEEKECEVYQEAVDFYEV